MEDEVIERIKCFADKAHGDQKRKYANEKYIVHPIRVMETCSRFSKKGSVLGAALLHDVLEDTATTKDDIFNFLSEIMGYGAAVKTVKLVEELSDVYDKDSYPDLNRDKRKNLEVLRLSRVSPDAQTIKYADIMDNAPDITKGDPGFARKYLQEAKTLLQKMKKGNLKLRIESLKVVEENIEKLRYRN